MSLLPKPRNIRRNWKPGNLDLAECAAEVSILISIEQTSYGEPAEARSWVMARGWRKGMLKRVDVAYRNSSGDVRFASVRFSGGFFRLRLGERAPL